jgi:hypothetical protein
MSPPEACLELAQKLDIDADNVIEHGAKRAAIREYEGGRDQWRRVGDRRNRGGARLMSQSTSASREEARFRRCRRRAVIGQKAR